MPARRHTELLSSGLLDYYVLPRFLRYFQHLAITARQKARWGHDPFGPPQRAIDKKSLLEEEQEFTKPLGKHFSHVFEAEFTGQRGDGEIRLVLKPEWLRSGPPGKQQWATLMLDALEYGSDFNPDFFRQQGRWRVRFARPWQTAPGLSEWHWGLWPATSELELVQSFEEEAHL